MKYRVCVNNKNFQILLDDIYPDPDQEMTVECGYNRYDTRIISWSKEQGISSIMIDGVPYDVEVIRDERGVLVAIKIENEIFPVMEIQSGKLLTTRPTVQLIKEGVVRAFMPGLIARVLKKEGDTVVEGDTVLYLEAMKMENAITAPREGRLTRIEPAEGSTVLTGDILFVVE
jgi:biotin carboxyl carrier protein